MICCEPSWRCNVEVTVAEMENIRDRRLPTAIILCLDSDS